MQIEKLYGEAEISNRVEELASFIEKDLKETDPLVLAFLDSSIFALADLMRNIKSNWRYGFIHMELSEDTGQILSINYPINLNVEGETLLIIKDVISTGVTELYLSHQLINKGVKEVLFLTILDIEDERRVPFKANYYFFKPKTARIYVGYGLKHEERFGNLPYIGYIKGL